MILEKLPLKKLPRWLIAPLYSIALSVAFPFVVTRYHWKHKHLQHASNRWLERLAYFQFPRHMQNGVWFHAVSVGEFIAIRPLILKLKALHPDLPIIVTTFTATSSKIVKKEFGDQVFHYYAPIDVPIVVKTFLNKVQPKMLIISEKDFWPYMIEMTGERNIPVVIASARLSKKSKDTYASYQCLQELLVKNIQLAIAQSDRIYTRFVELGFDENKIMISGNIKFDLQLPPDLDEKKKALQQLWQNESRPIIVAGSTHSGEEAIILEAMQAIIKQHPRALLILVPRHTERTRSVLQLCGKYNFKTSLRSSHQYQTDDNILLVDTLGELLYFYACSTISFVGGSLKNHGGHNILEPAALGKVVLAGPKENCDAVTEIYETMQKDKTLLAVKDAKTFASTVISLLDDPEKCQRLSEKARNVFLMNQGALQTHVDAIEKLL